MKRKKTKLEGLFSINKRQRKKGGELVLKDFSGKTYQSMKVNEVTQTSEADYVDKRIKSLPEHLEHLKIEFSNQPEILYYHATLIVLLRREFKVHETYQALLDLWTQEKDYLCEKLTLRWLVSAADSIADYDADVCTRAVMLNVVSMVNLIKIYETEKQLYQCLDINLEKLQKLEAEKAELFDGLSTFRIGTDDTLRNMRWRLDEITQKQPVAQKIMKEIFIRLHQNDTALKRFLDLHKDEGSMWM